VSRDKVIDATDAIVSVQRDYGNREDRKQARMKYLIESRGIEWFRKEVESRLGFATEDVRETKFETVADQLGWHEQGDGKRFCCVYISQGRIMDHEGGPAYKSMLREIGETVGCMMRVTPNTNILFYDLDPSQREAVDAILAKHHVPHSDEFTELRKVAHACVSMPTCGLALAESERIFNGVLDKIDDVLRDLQLEREPILVRMTGCPNGCARPYNCDFGFVGRGPNKYAMFVGGAITGDRLAGLEKKVVLLDDIATEMRVYLEDFAKNREAGETFSKWWGRTRTNGAAPHPEQFHIELAEREAAKAKAAAEVGS
ncbi:MAG: NADPH-dependent assimilatory sulfite reductase hemoprotein subunit, partial [Verrucomicrobiales bacterium]